MHQSKLGSTMSLSILKSNKLLKNYPLLGTIIFEVLSCDDGQEKFLNRSLSERSPALLDFSESLAFKIKHILGEHLSRACGDYVWMCERVLEEEVYFRRTGEYRVKSIKQAIEEVYSNSDYMNRYMNGLLISQLVWVNHTSAIHFYKEKYLSILKEKGRHLEIGPGHGLLLAIASDFNESLTLNALDISDASLKQTQSCFSKIAGKKVFNEVVADIMHLPKEIEKFDSVVMSELLEHLEEPLSALKIVHSIMEPNGKLYINVPINSPAADHIYLFENSSSVVDMVIAAGFKILETKDFPMTGYNLRQCQENKFTISCVIIASVE